MAVYEGQCHCGNLQLRFESAIAPENLPLRACQCSFCRAHGALTVSDPAGPRWMRRRGRISSAPDTGVALGP